MLDSLDELHVTGYCLIYICRVVRNKIAADIDKNVEMTGNRKYH